MQDNLPYLMSKLEQGEAEERDLESIRILLEQRVDAGRMPTELYFTMVQYVDQLEEKQQ